MDNPPAEHCLIAAASNIDPENNIVRAFALLHDVAPIQRASVFFRTKPINRPEQADYLNGAVAVSYVGSARTLKYDVLRPIEAALGRVRGDDAYAARPIDLDIALFGALVIDEEGLSIPDPDIRRRPFLAAALLDLVPDLRMPDTGALLKDCINKDELRRLTPDTAFSTLLQERFPS